MAEYTDIDFLRESSYLFPDFEDIIDNVDKNKREISPLDYLPLIDSKDNQEILDIILSDIPFYHVSPQKVLFDDDVNDINNLSESRDSGVVNVPSIMQTNDFYQTWFREAWGYLYNKLILDVYNKLRYPFISEHQYLMINTISNIIDTIFKSGNDYEKINLSTDYSSLNEVIKAKINSTISLLGITFNSNEFLDTIIESMYYGGVLSSSERDTEKYVYLLQEVRNELLKRKLAGTFSMYKIAISSLGRNGSFVNACKIKDVLDRHDNSSNGERYYRYVNILGLTTKKETSSDYTFDVESIYDDIPQKLVSEIFFSSKENEYFTSNNKNSYLRDSVSVVNWNALEGIVSQENIIDNYDYLDKLVDIESEEIIALDKKSLEDVNKTKIYRYLDHKSPSTMYESLLRANILDISADRLLYHDYTKTSGIDKSQYLTYSIANGNGISLIDSFWLNYLENSLKDKTKVIDNTLYGVQVSKYVDLTNPIAEKNFFGYEKKDSKVYLYYCSVKYSIEDFLITEISKRLITVIATRKKVDKEKLYNEGIIPFTYKDYVDENIELLEKESETLKYKGYNKCYFAFSESDITKNLLPSGDPSDLDSADSIIHNYSSDNESIRTIYYIVPRESDEVTTDGKVKLDYFWSEPISVIDLGEEDSYWFSITNLKNKHFSPDWKGLAFYLNPYLNFTKESASPLRHKNVFTTDILEAKRNIDTAKNSTGASENTILCNLTRMRELDYWANDNDSEDKSIWSDVLAKEGFSTYIGEKLGLYLNKSTSGDLTSNKNTTNAKIFGDNRTLDDLDIRDRSLSNKKNLTASNNTDSIETLIKNEGITPDKCTLYIVQYPNNLIRYFTYNDEKTSYTEIVKDDIMKLSTIYSDFSYKDYCISIQKGDNPKSSGQFDIFNHLEIVSTTKEDSGKECYWDTSLYNDQTEWGRTLCMNIHLSEDNNLADEKEHTLLQQKENDKNKNFSLVILKNADGYKVKFYWYPTRSTDLSWFITSNPIDISQNLRISASAYFVDDSNTGNTTYDSNEYLKVYLSLVVNGKLTKSSFMLKNILKESDYYDIAKEESLEPADKSNFCNGDTTITNINQKYYTNPDELLPIKQAPIYIGYDSSNSGTTTFMDIFDLRLYNEGKSPEELILLNMGTMYELYSYSPCAYNLAHNLYNDMGIFKIYNTQDKVNEKSLNTIRLFNRDVWDSILVDNFPITESEKSKGPQYKINWEDPKNDIDIYHKVDNTNFALNDCIEQELLDEREVYNNRALSEDIKLIYKGESIDIKKDNLLDIVLSTISPSVGNAVALSNSQSLTHYNNVFSSKAISIPVDTSSANNYFSYKADLYPTFTLDNSISLDSWLTRGNNITVTYDESNDYNLVTLADTSIKDSERNSAVYPLYVSDGEKVEFKIKNYKLSNTLCQLLKATSYYTEVCIPVPCKTKNEVYTEADITNLVGENIPCYYTTSDEKNYNIATTDVFQPDVTYYTTKDGNIFTAASIYSDDIIPAYYTKSGEKYTQCEGSATFTEGTIYFTKSIQYNPTYHYKWDGIRLLKSGDYKVTCKYPMRIRHFNPSNADDSSTTTFYGTLSFNINVEITPKNNTEVASNFTANILPSRKEYYKDNLGNHITYVDPQRDNNSLTYHFPHADVVITVTCNDKQITPTADGFVDTDTPLLLNKFYKSSNTKEYFTIKIGDTENLNSKDSITLNKDTAYELFIDYDGCVTELSLDGYNILENVNTTDYSNFMYTKDISDNLNIDSTKNAGFEVENNKLKNKSDDNLTFGDYTEITSNKNALYSLLVDSSYSKQWDVDNSYPIYYLDTIFTGIYNVSSTIYSETTFVSPAILDEVVAFTDSAGVFEKTDLIEKDILKDIYDELSIGNSLLKISRNSSMGLLSGLSGLMVKSGENKSIKLEDYNLYAYKKPALEFKNKGNSSEQTYTSLDSNNLFGRDVYSFIKDEWTVYDTYSQAIKAEDIIIQGNKRLLSISGYTSGTITLTSKENVFNTYGTFEVSLKAMGVSAVKVKITNYKSSTFNNACVEITLSKTDTGDTYSGSSTESIQANMVNVELTPNTGTETITISDFVIKKKGSQVNDSTNGIYNAYSSSTYSNIYLSSYEIAVLEDKNNTGKYIPIQFKSSIRQGNDGYLRPNYGSTQSMLFISNNSYQDYPENSSIKELVNPWRKQVNIVNDSGSLIYHIYSYTKNARGLDAIKQMDDKSILWFDNGGVELQSQSNGYSILIKSLHCDFTKYNSNLTLSGVDLLNDSISYLYNCFNINNYLNSDKSNVVVTNIQFLSKNSTNTNDKTILYELEYLPIIYDEKKHHLSVNLMLKKN